MFNCLNVKLHDCVSKTPITFHYFFSFACYELSGFDIRSKRTYKPINLSGTLAH